jgi:hypothetical protein
MSISSFPPPADSAISLIERATGETAEAIEHMPSETRAVFGRVLEAVVNAKPESAADALQIAYHLVTQPSGTPRQRHRSLRVVG